MVLLPILINCSAWPIMQWAGEEEEAIITIIIIVAVLMVTAKRNKRNRQQKQLNQKSMNQLPWKRVKHYKNHRDMMPLIYTIHI